MIHPAFATAAGERHYCTAAEPQPGSGIHPVAYILLAVLVEKSLYSAVGTGNSVAAAGLRRSAAAPRSAEAAVVAERGQRSQLVSGAAEEGRPVAGQKTRSMVGLEPIATCQRPSLPSPTSSIPA